MTVLYVPMTVLHKPMTILYVTMTVLHMPMTVLCVPMTVLYVPMSALDTCAGGKRRDAARLGRDPRENGRVEGDASWYESREPVAQPQLPARVAAPAGRDARFHSDDYLR